jgi:hypothetical protein
MKFVFEVGQYNDWFERKYKRKPEYTSHIVAETAGAAKYQYYQELESTLTFGELIPWIYCKKIGVANVFDLFTDKARFEDVCRQRGITFAYQGMRVEVEGQSGIIVGGNLSGNFDVIFDGKQRSSNCHPYWETVYYDRAWNVVADYRKKATG